MKTQKYGQLLVLAVFLASACKTDGICKVGDNSCPAYTVCYAGKNPKEGAKGICTEGEFSAAGELVAAVRDWRLVLSAVGEVAPWRWDKRDNRGAAGAENAQAGWVVAGEAVVEVEVVGLMPGESVELRTGHEVEAECKSQGRMKEARGELWKCTLGEGWFTAKPGREDMETTEVVELKLQPGEKAEERVRAYRVDVQPPRASLRVVAGAPCTVGSTGTCPVGGHNCTGIGGSTNPGAPGFCAGNFAVPVHLCMHAQDTQSGLRSFEPKRPFALLDPYEEPLPVDWKYDEGNSTSAASCWTGVLPVPPEAMDTLLFFMDVKAVDMAGNVLWAEDSIYGSFERAHCLAQAAEGLGLDAVKAPLAFSGYALLFATSQGEGASPENNALYFFDTHACALASSLHTGAVQGPMLPMGASGKIALALGKGGPAGAGPRLAVVEEQGFVKEDCFPGDLGIQGSLAFDKGLSLISAGRLDGTDGEGKQLWRFTAPANSEEAEASRLVAYAPNDTWPAGRCMANISPWSNKSPSAKGHFMLTPLHYFSWVGGSPPLYTSLARREMSRGGPGSEVGFWEFDGNAWHLKERFSPGILDQSPDTYTPEYDLPNPTGLAAGRKNLESEDLWMSGDGFWRVYDGYISPVLTSRWPTSPAAVDDKGRAYVIVAAERGYEMQRFSKECTVGKEPCPLGEECLGYGGMSGFGSEGLCRLRSDFFDERIVGSPVLGEPSEERAVLYGAYVSEVYAVSTQGTVIALNAETLEPLWLQSLGIRVLPTAQPVLLKNTHAGGGGTLWVVGAQGEVRGIRVASEGLSLKASWPKAFRDNCNTSSSAIKPDDMPGCFGQGWER